jgi:hypothetical protein
MRVRQVNAKNVELLKCSSQNLDTPLWYSVGVRINQSEKQMLRLIHPCGSIQFSTTRQRKTMSSLSVFIGNLTHEDSRDGYEDCIIMSEDISAEMKAETLEDSEGITILTFTRTQMDLLAKSVDSDSDLFGFGEGNLLDLTEPYVVGWDNQP